MNTSKVKDFLDSILTLLFPEKESLLGVAELRQLQSATPETLLKDAPSKEPLPHGAMFASLNYQHPLVKELIWQLKYKHKKKLAKLFAECLYSSMIEELAEKKLFDNFTNPLLVPIPLSKKRLRERGYNQTELIASEMSLIDSAQNFSVNTSVLYRIKDNEHQARLKDKKSRLENSRETFAILDASKIRGRNIILLDDVITSGATMLSARKELLRTGAREVYMISVAH